MTEKNTKPLLRKITVDFGCGAGLGIFLGILISTKTEDNDFWTIVIIAIIFGVLSAVFGKHFWRFMSKEK